MLGIAPQAEDWDRDNYGKVVGQILDASTGEPVEEVFGIDFYDCSNMSSPKPPRFTVDSNDKGFFSITIEPGIYCLHFTPLSKTSKYCFEPDPIIQNEIAHIVRLKKGQLVKVIKKVSLGGKIRIVLVDQHGQKIVPNSMFDVNDMNKLHVEIEAEGILDQITADAFCNGDKLGEGEILLTQLYPGKYTIYVELAFMGYGNPIKIQDINVSRSITTIQNVVINFDDRTGIEGIIIYNNSLPVEKAGVHISKQYNESKYDIESLRGDVRADRNGYYKIVGLNEGRYRLSVLYNFKDGFPKSIYNSTVIIKKGSIILKDIILDTQN